MADNAKLNTASQTQGDAIKRALDKGFNNSHANLMTNSGQVPGTAKGSPMDAMKRRSEKT